MRFKLVAFSMYILKSKVATDRLVHFIALLDFISSICYLEAIYTDSRLFCALLVFVGM